MPTDYVVGVGQTVTPQATVETEVPIVVGTQANVAASFTSADFTLKIDDFADRFLLKMTNDLAAYVAQDVMGAANKCPNIVYNLNGSSALISPTADTWLAAGAVLDDLSAGRGEPRKAILSPTTMARSVSSLAGLFNPAPQISENYRVGAISGGISLGIEDWRIDQTVINHTTGSATSATTSGSQTNANPNATGTLTISAISGTMAVGDIFTVDTVYGVNRLTKASTGALATFVVTSAVSNGNTTITYYPGMIAASGSPDTVQYANVTNLPSNGETVTPVLGAGVTYRSNLVFRKEFATLVVADLPLIRNGVVKSARESYDGVSLRMVEGYDVTNDLFIDRIDILYGWACPRPEWGVIVADAL